MKLKKNEKKIKKDKVIKVKDISNEKKLNKNEKKQINSSLLNIITPMGLEIKRNNLIIGENLGKVYGVIRYPQKVDYGWLSKVTNIPSTIVSIGFKPVDNSALINSISKSIIQNRGTVESAKDPLTRQRAEKSAEDGENIMRQIDQRGETVGLMNISIMPIAIDEKTFTKVSRQVESKISSMKCKVRILANMQKEGLQNISPTFPTIPSIENTIQRIVPMSTFIGGFPFASSGFNDGNGYYFSKDSNGGLVIVDSWLRGGDRTNSNYVILGIAGTGKSTAVKNLVISEIIRGTKILFIDPEAEYITLTRNLGGDVINAGGDTRYLINPLQIRPAPRDEEDDEKEKNDKFKLYDDDKNGLSDMALHMKNLEIFFKLYIPSITDMQKAMLKLCLVELYNKFNIYWDTDIRNLSNDDFPIFTDLYNLVLEKSEKKNAEKEYKDLSILLNDIANGSDSFLWNGYTTITSTAKCICLNTFSLQNTSDNIKRAQYFNLLTWCWEQMSKDRNEKVLLICDEAYLMIDENVPQSLVFLRNVAKRARKYEAGLVIVSHSVVDFLAGNIKQYGQALLDIPCYKILFGTDGQNLKELSSLYSLTEAEEELLLSKLRGHALFMVGSKRLHINIEIPEHRKVLWGTEGGR